MHLFLLYSHRFTIVLNPHAKICKIKFRRGTCYRFIQMYSWPSNFVDVKTWKFMNTQPPGTVNDVKSSSKIVFTVVKNRSKSNNFENKHLTRFKIRYVVSRRVFFLKYKRWHLSSDRKKCQFPQNVPKEDHRNIKYQ